MKKIVCTILALAFSIQCFAGFNLKEFSALEGDCKISFPIQPQHVKEKMFLPAANSWMEYDIYVSILQPKAVYLMLAAQYPKKVGKEEMKGCLESFLRGMASHNPDNQLIFADLNEIKGKVALEFFMKSSQAFFRGKIFMEGGKLILIAIESKDEAEIEGLFYPFAESFRWEKK
jgi:hypothetical protein